MASRNHNRRYHEGVVDSNPYRRRIQLLDPSWIRSIHQHPFLRHHHHQHELSFHVHPHEGHHHVQLLDPRVGRHLFDRSHRLVYRSPCHHSHLLFYHHILYRIHRVYHHNRHHVFRLYHNRLYRTRGRLRIHSCSPSVRQSKSDSKMG